MGALSSLYATAAEFLAYPTGLDVQNLIPDGTAQQNAAELAAMLQSASAFAEQITYQPLYARVLTETAQATAGPGGRLQVRLRAFPAQQVLAAQWMATTAGGWQSIPLANVRVTGALSQQYIADDMDYRSVTGWGRGPLTVTTQYVAGYPNAVLTAPAAAGATSLVVDDATGMAAPSTLGALALPGTSLVIYDATGGGQETVSVASVTGTTVTLASPLQYGHAEGVRVSAVPDAVTTATILLASYLIKGRRAGGGIVMSGTVQPGSVEGTEETDAARRLLRPYVRVV